MCRPCLHARENVKSFENKDINCACNCLVYCLFLKVTKKRDISCKKSGTEPKKNAVFLARIR